ncbi:MAG: hypothetical protein ACOC44_06435 [Promethearchaeia archaeon]
MNHKKKLLSKIYRYTRQEKQIDDKLIEFIEEKCETDSEKVLSIIKNGITKYIYKPSQRTIWIAIGETNQYLIFPQTYCSCVDFYKNVVIERKRDCCKHLIAQCICEALNDYQEVQFEDSEFTNFLNDIKSYI